jgi:hypothetical protein
MMVWGQERWSQIQVIISNPLSPNTYVLVLVTEAVCASATLITASQYGSAVGERASIPVSERRHDQLRGVVGLARARVQQAMTLGSDRSAFTYGYIGGDRG